ncbi:MAG: histidine phosphatase family protein [Roseiflexaceae bacterium]|nr:histidine phosphatase family protein [Roseiflexaceae bacterium]
MRLIIIRHGESEWNRIGRYQCQADAPLSELGERQAQALATRLRSEPIHAIFSSSLQRARRTGEAVAAHHPAVPFTIEPALLEIDHGEWQGLLSSEVVERFGVGLIEWQHHPTRAQMPGGESFSNILKRVLDFRERLCNEFPDQNVLISTHDVVVKILVADALGMDMDRINRIWVTNASVSVIEYGEGMPYLVSLSEACHLGRLEVARENQKAI